MLGRENLWEVSGMLPLGCLPALGQQPTFGDFVLVCLQVWTAAVLVAACVNVHASGSTGFDQLQQHGQYSTPINATGPA